MLHRLAAAAAAAILAVPAARAQNLSAICERATHPAVGAWAQYRLIGGREDGATIRMAVVGRESRGGTRYLWVEVSAHGFSGPNGSPMPAFINKMLVPSLGPGMDRAVAHVIKLGSAPAMEMPVRQTRSRETPGTDILSRCRNATVVGWERVTVPAGTFRALHIRDSADKSESWVDPDLPLAYVKGTSEGGDAPSAQVVLVRHGTGARSQITEKPRPYDPHLFMQMMMQAQGARPHP
jgi:hypothetical protein